MIKKYVYGCPFDTEAVVSEIKTEAGALEYVKVSTESGLRISYKMADEDIIYGLGESVRGINKRGYSYVSWTTDDPNHTEDKRSLYAAHNFIVVACEKPIGLFVDYPGKLTFDLGYTKTDEILISADEADFVLYVIDGDTPYDIVKQFRSIIGRSYIPPKFAFGYGQSRWGYKDEKDFTEVAETYRKLGFPMDTLYLDIDYMDSYKDFTVSKTGFNDFEAFVKRMREEYKLHVVPIIDAGVKIEKDYKTYEEGVKNNYFVKRRDGSDFVAWVWPGPTHFPDVLNKDARKWFGDSYKFLLDKGVDAFWNDMNEPAIFYSKEGLAEAKKAIDAFYENPESPEDIFALSNVVGNLKNSEKDYAAFYHNVDGRIVRHDRVHNLFGYNMTRAAGEAFERICPDKRILMFSRSSYIGMHRYGGVWQGDNCSWWSHILLNLKMMANLNMCGFLYTGADLGGFGVDTTRDLMLRWLALGVFTPLMRNHSALGTRRQECYQFEKPEDFRHIINVRYRLIPYIYSEYMKAALSDDMMFKPLAFVYPEDKFAASVEDQLIIGDEIMIAPVYTQNAPGRYVYLPEDMTFVKFMPDGSISCEKLSKGHHYVYVALNEVPLFIRAGRKISLVDAAKSVEDIDMNTLVWLGDENAEYELYDDDGVTPVE